MGRARRARTTGARMASPAVVPALIPVLVTAFVLAGCSGDSADPAGSSTASGTPTPAPSPSVRVVDGVEITPPGTQLAFGDTAAVVHRADDRRGVLKLTVKSARKGRLSDFEGFDLDDPYKRRGNYYYVRVRVENAGENRFGDVPVPLLGISGDNTLLQPVQFTSSFATCPTEPLPAGFRPGKDFQTCLVYLSPDRGELEGVAYRPREGVIPIEWRGKVRPAPKQKSKAKGQGGQQ